MTPESQHIQPGYFEQKNTVVNPTIDRVLGLDSNLQPHIHKFRNGMSGAATIHVEELGQVIKWNQDREKIVGEAKGYTMLAETPLAPYLLPVDTTHIEDGVIATPYYNGIQLREGVQKETVDPNDALDALSTLLTVKKEWWASQEHADMSQEEKLISMQREEWADTIVRIQDLLPTVAEHYSMTVDKLLFSPLIVDGKEVPALATSLESAKFFLASRPNRIVLAHNDATGANVLIKPEIGEIKIIDYQWTGKPSDPAEAFVRMGKWVSTSMLSQKPDYDIISVNGAIHLESKNAPVNPLAQRMQAFAESAIPAFSQALGQPDFGSRIQAYMSGSYLRELALSKQRGGPESSMFAIIQAGESLIKSR